MIMRMVEVREALENVVMHRKFVEYMATLFNRQNGVQAHALAMQVRSHVLDENFWRRCRNYTYKVEDVMKALRVFDEKEPAMEKAWLTMNNLRKHIFRLRYPPFSLTLAIAEEIEENFMKRWDMTLTDLHYAGAMLNPYLRRHMELQQNGEAKRALNRVFRRLSNPLEVGFNEVMVEMSEYEERFGPYSPEEAPDIRVANLQPHQWWSKVGGEALPKIAKRVLVLMCSASLCEPNWSMYSFVHNKSRNRLGTKKGEDVVYIYTNTRLLRGRLGADPLRWYENNVFSEDEDKSVDDDSKMDDGDDDDNESGGEGMEGNKPINDDERRDDEGRENIDDTGVFDWNEIDAEIEQENRDPTERVAVPKGEESDRSYSPAPCHDRLSKDIEDDENFNLGQNNNVVEHLNNEDDTIVGDDNGENNMTGRVNEVVAPIIQNSAPHGRMEIGSSSNFVPTFDSNSVENAHSSRRSVHVEQMDIESPSMTMAMPRNVREDKAKVQLVHRLLKQHVLQTAVATVIGGGRETEENVVVGVNSNQNTVVRLEKMGSGTVVIGDGTGTSGDGMGTSRDGKSLHHILRPSSVPKCEQRGSAVDVISLGRPPQPHRPVLQTGVVPLEVQSVSRSIETARTSIQRGPTIIGGRLKRPRMGIEPFLHTETPGNPLTIPVVLQNRGPQVDSDASDRNAKRHKRLHSRNVDGQFRFEIWNESSEVEGLGQSQYGDEGAIMGDDEQRCDESDPDSNRDREEAPNDPDI